MAEIDPQIDAMLEEGMVAIDGLPTHASRIAGLLQTHFPAQTLEAVHAAMKPGVEAAKSSVNPKVAELSSLLREEAAVAASQFRACEMWIRLKAPAVSDGNNFGVDVQNYVLGELQAMRQGMETMGSSGRDYFWARGQGLDKLFGDDKSTTSQSEHTESETKGDTKTEKTSKSTSKDISSSKPPGYPDYHEYVLCLDVRQYHLVFNHLTDLRNHYLKAHVLFAKNMKRLSDPRGEGAEGGRNVMSMF